MWRKKAAGKWLGYLGAMGGATAFLTGFIGCIWKESVMKYIWLGILVAGFVFFFVWLGGQALTDLFHPNLIGKMGSSERMQTKERLLLAADSLAMLCGSLEKKEPGVEEGFQEFAAMFPEAVCADCDRCVFCWQDRAGERVPAAYAMYWEALNGSLPQAGEVENRFGGCVNPERIAGEYALLPMKERNKKKLQRKAEEGKTIAATQLQMVSELLRECSEELTERTSGEEEMEERIAEALLKEGIFTEQIRVRQKKGMGLRICLTAYTKYGRQIPIRRAAQCIGITLERPIAEGRDCERYIVGKEKEYYFEEEAGYLVLTGVASKAKYGEKKSGDSCSFFYPESGETVMLLSDGMGSGEDAGGNSEAVIELLEQFLAAGFDRKISVRLVNLMLLLRSEGKSFSTADISIINPYAGTCEFVKLGAAATYIKRESWVESVASESLPIGMLSEAEYDMKEKKLYDGDYVIMMTDGILEALGERMNEVLFLAGRKKTDRTPQGIAGEILQAALEQCDFRPGDDMTVLVAELVKKQLPFYLRNT